VGPSPLQLSGDPRACCLGCPNGRIKVPVIAGMNAGEAMQISIGRDLH